MFPQGVHELGNLLLLMSFLLHITTGLYEEFKNIYLDDTPKFGT